MYIIPQKRFRGATADIIHIYLNSYVFTTNLWTFAIICGNDPRVSALLFLFVIGRRPLFTLFIFVLLIPHEEMKFVNIFV